MQSKLNPNHCESVNSDYYNPETQRILVDLFDLLLESHYRESGRNKARQKVREPGDFFHLF